MKANKFNFIVIIYVIIIYIIMEINELKQELLGDLEAKGVWDKLIP